MTATPHSAMADLRSVLIVNRLSMASPSDRRSHWAGICVGDGPVASGGSKQRERYAASLVLLTDKRFGRSMSAIMASSTVTMPDRKSSRAACTTRGTG